MPSTAVPPETNLAAVDPADWRATPHRAGAIRPVIVTGRYRFARRCIDPPYLDLSPVPDAARYELLVTSLDTLSEIHRLDSPTSRIDLTPIWSRLPFGRLQLTARAWDSQNRLIAAGPLVSLIRSPDWDGQPASPLDYRAAGHGVIDYLAQRVPAAPAHLDMPAYMWHAAMATARDTPALDLQFPALSYPSLIGLFVSGAAEGAEPRASDLLSRARQLADFLIAHPGVTSGPLAGAPLSTMNQEGTGGLFEEDRITLVRLGWTGCVMLSLAEATGDARYATYAERLGRILLDTQQPDGSWPYRVRLSDGAILEPYTAAVVMALLLLERLDAASPRGPYTAPFDRGLTWILDNPVQTGLWQQMYEDVPSLEPYANLEQWAALETAMLLLRRQHPDADNLARALVRYVEDQFVVFADDPIFPTPYLPFTPSVLEQYRCYWPMDFHTANYARAALALHQATGEIVWAHKAIAAANTIVQCQGPDGRFSTLVPDRRLGATPPFSDWFNCMAHAADVLLRIGPTLTAIARKEGGDGDLASATTTDPLRTKGAQG